MIPWAAPAYWGNEERYVGDALRSTWISGGPFVERLEREVRDLLGGEASGRETLATSNGTTALQLPCVALGLGPGDEVVVPGFAFMAAANVALQLRAQPVFCEVDSRTWCARAEDVERVLSPRTRAIVAVHTYGNVCDMDPLVELARRRGIALIEDAAESFASRYRGRLAGAIAPIGTFSFHATKTITTGEGGMTVTSDAALAARMRLYRSHGMDRSKAFYWHEVAGHNFRLTNLQAALGCAQLEHLDDIVRERTRLHNEYRARLGALDGMSPQHFEPAVTPVLWAYALKVDARAFPQGRDALVKQLAERGIETRPGFHPASEMRHLYTDCPPLPVCEELGRTVISLPTWPGLKDEVVDRICDSLKALRR